MVRSYVSFSDSRKLSGVPRSEGQIFFESRTRSSYPNETTINNFLSTYVSMIQDSDGAVLFNAVAGANFFSSQNIADVVFHVRHPLHSFLSWGKSRRHGADLERAGGPKAIKPIMQWCQLWSATIEEYLRCKEKGLNPKLIRFEYAQEDSHSLSDLGLVALYSGWKSERRNFHKNFLSCGQTVMLKKAVEKNYYRIYSSWGI